ncbi:hypothetical protein [Sphaerotilus mobilis]|uniref:Uncharacterized protein n=1 Tax=Sphaerotilus mobilis TaxID=47994 RepID=A0A4Q7LE38_9BURK|nr:hypothetical protein [Sphaerotilus mobilis]RZS52272.1 hypothetical protein EV685_3464 [Sphaerotilus mobilis]
MDTQIKNALGEGLVDALGFVGGALAGGLLARWLGFDFLTNTTWDAKAMGGIALVGLGAGLGKAAARKLLKRETVADAAAPASKASAKSAKAGKTGKR